MDKLFDEFLGIYLNKSNVGNTPENKGQCTGLVNVWANYLKLPHLWGNAKDIPLYADLNKYQRVVNTPTGIPPKGAILIWTGNYNPYYIKGVRRTGFGHTAIVQSANVNTITVFSQNDPLGSKCIIKKYPNYNHVYGWLIPKIAAQPKGDDVILNEIKAIYDGVGTPKEKVDKIFALKR